PLTCVLFLTDVATTAVNTLSLHDALPIWRAGPAEDQEDQDRLHHRRRRPRLARHPDGQRTAGDHAPSPRAGEAAGDGRGADQDRSEEHTSELQSRENLVCRLLLEKKNATR